MNCLTLKRKPNFFEMSLTICQSAQRNSHREKVSWWNIQITADLIATRGATFQEVFEMRKNCLSSERDPFPYLFIRKTM
jgi:hypothetical protein